MCTYRNPCRVWTTSAAYHACQMNFWPNCYVWWLISENNLQGTFLEIYKPIFDLFVNKIINFLFTLSKKVQIRLTIWQFLEKKHTCIWQIIKNQYKKLNNAYYKRKGKVMFVRSSEKYNTTTNSLVFNCLIESWLADRVVSSPSHFSGCREPSIQ